VSDYGGLSLSTTFSSHLKWFPDISEAHTLRRWWETTGRSGAGAFVSAGGGGAGGGGGGPAGGPMASALDSMGARHSLGEMVDQAQGRSGSATRGT
jgi:hypothetical protein